MLLSERSMPVQSIEVYGDMDPKISLQIVAGAWLGAFEDGVDPREDAAVLLLGEKLSVALPKKSKPSAHKMHPG